VNKKFKQFKPMEETEEREKFVKSTKKSEYEIPKNPYTQEKIFEHPVYKGAAGNTLD
jgi:hypothetical protein